MIEQKIKAAIRDVPDFPRKGILFRDIAPILLDPVLCGDIVEELVARSRPLDPGLVLGIESRGFLFGMMLARTLNVPFVPVRKQGKLPGKTVSHTYSLEYGTAVAEVQQGIIQKNSRVLVHDDLLATGGTAAAAAELALREGAQVAGFAFLVELAFLHGRKFLDRYGAGVTSLATYM